jgi:uncharacterized CHY-type Zn-finger protein
MKLIHGVMVHGAVVDDESRCSHYFGETDIIAIKFKCCGKWFPCRECHDGADSHAAEIWPAAERDEKAVLCGKCGSQLTINEYFNCDFSCPSCKNAFNSGCRLHYELYFEMNDR